jgi:hypothetical protein
MNLKHGRVRDAKISKKGSNVLELQRQDITVLLKGRRARI